MVTETQMTAQQALDLLQPLGFVIERETDRIRIGRGAMKFTLPKRNEYLNPTLNRILKGVADDLANKQAGVTRRSYKRPISVMFNDTMWAVVETGQTFYVVQSLEDGRRTRIDKSQVEAEIWDPEPLARSEPQEVETVSEEPQVSEEAPEDVRGMATPFQATTPLTPLTNPSDLAALIRGAQRRAEYLKLQYDQTMAKIAQINEQLEVTNLFLKSLGAPPVEDFPQVQPKRTVLPPTGPSRTAIPNKSVLQDKMRMAWLDLGKPDGYGYLQRVKTKATELGASFEGVKDSELYKMMKDIRDDA